MSRGENGVPETPEWQPVPRCWPEHGLCDCPEPGLPESIQLGEN